MVSASVLFVDFWARPDDVGRNASAKWYMVVGTLPNLVQIVDTTTDKVVKTIPLEGQGRFSQISTNPATPRFAYVTTNLDQAVAVVDLEQGKQVATYKLSSDTETVRVSATNLNPKGDRLYISELPLEAEPRSLSSTKSSGFVVIRHRHQHAGEIVPGARTDLVVCVLAGWHEDVHILRRPGHHGARFERRPRAGHDPAGPSEYHRHSCDLRPAAAGELSGTELPDHVRDNR